MPDKRNFNRICVDLPSMLFDEQGKEIECRVYNVCQHGICLRTSYDNFDKANINPGTQVKVQFVDSYDYCRVRYSDILTQKATVRHITEKNGEIFIGCYLSDPEFESYATRKEVSAYKQSLYEIIFNNS